MTRVGGADDGRERELIERLRYALLRGESLSFGAVDRRRCFHMVGLCKVGLCKVGLIVMR